MNVEDKKTASNPQESPEHDDNDAQEPPPQISEGLPPKSTNKSTSPGENVGKSEDFGVNLDEVPPVQQHQTGAVQDHRHGEG